MKIKKTRLTTLMLALVLCAAFMLPGCSKNDKPSYKGEAEIQENMHIPSLLAARQGGILFFTEHPSMSQTKLIYSLDIESGEVLPLCAKPECTHDSEDCGGYFDFGNPDTRLMIYDGRLYWTNDYTSPGTALFRQSLDGTGREEVVKLDPKLERFSGEFSGIYDGRLYKCGFGFYVSDGKPSRQVLAYSRPLEKDGEPKEIYRAEMENDDNVCVLAKMNGGVLYFAVFIEDDETGDRQMELHAYDMEADEHALLYSGPIPDGVMYFFCEDGKLVFSGAKIVFTYSLEDGEIETLYSSPLDWRIYMGEETMLEMTSMTGYRCLDRDGKVLSVGEQDVSLFHEDRQYKTFIGCIDDVFYFLYESLGVDARYDYLVGIDCKTGEFNKLWENRIRDRGE